MEKLIKQQEILNKIANVMSEETKSSYEFANLILTTGSNHENPTSMETDFEFGQKGSIKNTGISIDNFLTATDAAFELHKLMREQSGRAWSQMTLTLSGDGRLTTEFVYPDAE